MLFFIKRIDREDTAQIRKKLHPRHKDHVATVAHRIAFAGPLLEPGSETKVGSIMVGEFDDVAAVEAWLANDPFTLADIYSSTEILRFTNNWAQRAGFPAAAS